MNMDLVNDVGKAIWASLQADSETWAVALVASLFTVIGLYVLYSLAGAIVSYVRVKWSEVIPAIRLAFHWLGEKRMRERNQREHEDTLASDAITEALDNLLLEGKLSRKARNRIWKKLGHAMALPDLLVRKVPHPKAIINGIERRHIDKTPVPLPDIKFTPENKFKNLMQRKTA